MVLLQVNVISIMCGVYLQFVEAEFNLFWNINSKALLQKKQGVQPFKITRMASDNINKVLGTLPEDIEKAGTDNLAVVGCYINKTDYFLEFPSHFNHLLKSE